MQKSQRYYSIMGAIFLLVVGSVIIFTRHRVAAIDGTIAEYTDQDRSATLKIFYDNQVKLDPKSIGGKFEYQLDRRVVNDNHLYIAVAKNKEGNVVGFITYYREMFTTGRIYYLAVDSTYRKKGYATALLRYACDDLRKRESSREVIINVNPHNTSAINLYKKFGFTLLEEQKDSIVLRKAV